jgi:ABC-type Fe3+-hydroxamate transport system substrate-binding protein
MKQFLVIFTAAFFLLSCQNQTGSAWQTLTFIQDTPLMTHVNLGDTAHAHGDGMAFEAVLKDTTGTPVGEVLGWMVTVDIEDGDSANPVHITDRVGTMVIKFDDENKIVSSGGTSYKRGDKLLKLGVVQKSAIVGGTGKYKGIKGEITTTRNEDGTYKHLLDVKMAN